MNRIQCRMDLTNNFIVMKDVIQTESNFQQKISNYHELSHKAIPILVMEERVE